MSPLVACLWICGAAIALTWVTSLITREYSWVDRIWSILPVIYVWVFAGAAGMTNARLVLMAGLVTAWGARLTINFARKGGYARGGEDYRWAALRERMSPAVYQVFNLLFISLYQNVIILGITLPAWTVFTAAPARAIGIWDLLLAAVFLAFLTGETIADQQQWNFHRRKKAANAAGGEPSPSFLTTGLFRFSRHPNFFFEQSQWWVLYLFAIAATGTVVHWTLIFPLLLSLLFVGSTVFTEAISRARHPDYVNYQGTTSAIIPWFPRKRERSTTPA